MLWFQIFRETVHRKVEIDSIENSAKLLAPIDNCPLAMPNAHPDAPLALIRKLETVFSLSDKERSAVMALPMNVRVIEAHQDVVREGDRPDRSFVILEGATCAFKMTELGGRQILSFYITGDMPDLQSLHLGIMDMSVGTVTPSKLGFVQHSDLTRMCESHPRIAAALWRETLVYAAIFREWITNIGRRQALGRAAHLLCEYISRARAIGLTQDFDCEFPITQRELADAMGLSDVHVNRTLKALRKRGLIELQGRYLAILNWEGLTLLADFDPTYLHTRGINAAE